ncbi:DUF1772 domain-containing protein [Dyadobacter sandarakinus]|uniref:DUF1772 domain-containing protein n=1 Tax=Dyadobacter sandarakinus TaxID=2747268 RepID=A0ABX7I6Y5_9BACT|nr:DUF1772 domain-containing protein [Dyadobacter sandarakinus]QRR01483.1 DUF1772 domain-containing protein [Dyadobacter sandarakinus]
MKNIFYAVAKGLLFAACSMYFGTGWSLVLFSFPIAKSLTPDNYYLQFVPQVTAATHFFTYMTMVMIACYGIFIIEKWRSREKWVPITGLICILASTFLTMKFIFPYNEKMSSGIKEINELQIVLNDWIDLNILRVAIWTVQWLVVMFYFSINVFRYEKTH